MCAVAVYASDGGEHGEAHAIPWTNFLWRVLNFIVFVGFLWKFAGKKAKDFFMGRRYQIETELADLDTRKGDAERRLLEVEKSIANIEQERAAILAEYRQQGEDLKASIVAKADKAAEQIKAQAELTSAQEAKVAVDQIRAEVADMVIAAAQTMLQQKLSKEDHQKLVDDYITKVVLH
jgi:F-type H+-transporting ATPase subunit b